MTQSSKPPTALIIVGILLVLLVMVLYGGCFSGWMLGAVRLPWQWHHGGSRLVAFLPTFTLFSFGFLIQTALAIWVGIDANKRGMNGLLWGLLVFITFVVGLIVYLIVVAQPTQAAQAAPPGAPPPSVGAAPSQPGAPDPAAVRCDECGGSLEPSFRTCPYCGAALGGRCPGCERPTRKDWKVCPYCSTALET
jgi:hypothetical protein